MEHVALKNKSHFLCIKKPRGQTKAWIKGGRIQKGHLRLREWFIHQRKDFERKQAEIREREEETKRKTEEFRERERRYSEKLRNGTPEERERSVYFNRKKRGMEDMSLISWKGDGEGLSETLSDWFKKNLLSFYRNSQLCWRERSLER